MIRIRNDRMAVVAIVLMAIATFANSLWNGFALDDNAIIATNPRVHQLADQSLIWLTPYWPNFGRTLGLWRPLTIFGYAVQWSIGDGATWVFHAANIALHALASVLVFALLRTLASRAGALAGALLFAVHPLHTEVVANVVGQAELLAASAVLGACILYASRPDGIALSRGRAAGIVSCFALGMLAKEGAIVIPPLLVALDLAQRRLTLDRSSASRWLRAIAVPMLMLLAVLLAYFIVRIQVLGSIGGIDAAPNLPFLREEGRIFSAFRAWPEYVRLLVFPFDLSADYSPGVILPATGFTPMVTLGLVLLIGTAILALATPVRPRTGLVAAWFLITVFPVSNLVLPIGVLMAERILYLPSVAIAMVAAHAWDWAAARARGARLRVAAAAAAVVLVAFALKSVARNPDWKDTEAVWAALLEDHPESYRAQWVNGELAERAGRLDLARGYWEVAARIWPDDPALLNELAILYLRLEETDRAIAMLDRSHELADFSSSTEILRSFALLKARRYHEALSAIDDAVRLGAPPAPVLGLRAQALQGLGRWNEAVGAWRSAMTKPRGDGFLYRIMLARALGYAGLTAEALASLDTARTRAPADPSLARDLAQLDAAIRSGCFHPGTSRHVIAPKSTPQSCADPLAVWGVILPTAQHEVANSLQNAMGPGAQGTSAEGATLKTIR
ncbi:MAG: tetratricopeptide repeat protein [Longimicrobiales bacterium]